MRDEADYWAGREGHFAPNDPHCPSYRAGLEERARREAETAAVVSAFTDGFGALNTPAPNHYSPPSAGPVGDKFDLIIDVIACTVIALIMVIVFILAGLVAVGFVLQLIISIAEFIVAHWQILAVLAVVASVAVQAIARIWGPPSESDETARGKRSPAKASTIAASPTTEANSGNRTAAKAVLASGSRAVSLSLAPRAGTRPRRRNQPATQKTDSPKRSKR